MSDDDIRIGGLEADIRNIKTNVSEVKSDVKSFINYKSSFVTKTEYEKDKERIHLRITNECVSKEELKSLKVPLWIIASAIIGGVTTWLGQTILKTIGKLLETNINILPLH